MGRKRSRRKLSVEEELVVSEYMETKVTYTKKEEKLPKIKNFVAKTDKQGELVTSIEENEITIAIGSSGTGKTYVACATALSLLEQGYYKKIVLVKSVTPIPGEDIGFIPGSVKEKMDPYMQSFCGNIDKILGKGASEELMKQGMLEILPLSYIRGLSIDDSIVLNDECVVGDSIIYVQPKEKKNLYRESKSNIRGLVKNFEKDKNIKVLSHNDITGEVEYKKVLNAKCTGIKDILGITVEQRTKPIKCSLEHPFAVYRDSKIEYVPAKDLLVGDRLLIVKEGSNNHTIYNNNNYDILMGFILGDGSLAKNNQKASDIYRLKKQHGMKQLEYCKFSAKILNVEVAFTGKSGYTGEVEPVCQTKSLYLDPNFIYSLYNKNLKKYISEDCIDYITKRTLAL